MMWNYFVARKKLHKFTREKTSFRLVVWPYYILFASSINNLLQIILSKLGTDVLIACTLKKAKKSEIKIENMKLKESKHGDLCKFIKRILIIIEFITIANNYKKKYYHTILNIHYLISIHKVSECFVILFCYAFYIYVFLVLNIFIF